MKRILPIAVLASLFLLAGSYRNAANAQPGYDDGYDQGYDQGYDRNADVSYQTFYDELSPYGRWVDYPEYGYVWVPQNIQGFRPYETNGHWVWSDDYEWMWVSNYSWGWAPFHYGRWFSDPYYGWMWVPGYDWSPAWVAWRDGGDYYGWAPLRPGINISINFSIGSYNPPVDYWCFAPRRYISSYNIYNHCIERSRNVTIINNTTIINNYNRRNNVFVTGPRRADAERYAGRINPVRLRESSRPGRTQFRNNEVSMFRPRVQRNSERQFTPRNFDRYERNGSAQRPNVLDRNRNNRDNTVRSNDAGSSRTNNRPFDRRNNNNNEVIARDNDNRNNQGRNIFDRGNRNRSSNDEGTVNRPIQPRRNNEVRPQQQNNENQNTQRPNIFDRGNRGNRNDDRVSREATPQRNFEPIRQQRQQQETQNRGSERRNIFDRGNSAPAQQPERREARAQQQQQRQSFPQAERQSQPRQFERRESQSNNGNGNNENGRRFGRR